MDLIQYDISVVCTTYNDDREISNLLDDILSQEYLPGEIVIADGGSTDKTIEIIEWYIEKSVIPIVFLTGKRLNISEGLNTAIKNSNGKYIAIVSTGNRYDSLYLYNLYSELSKTDSAVVFPPIRGKEDNKFSKLYNQAFLFGELGSRIPSNHGGLLKRQVFESCGLFYEHFIYAGEDAEFYDRVRAHHVSIACSENAILKWDVPHNMKQFKKQVRNYTIAAMQIEDSWKLIMNYNKLYMQVIILLFIILCLIFEQLIIGTILLTAVIVYYILSSLKQGFIVSCLRQYRKWYQLFIIFGNLKYLSVKYKVDASRLEKLNERGIIQ